MQFPKTLIVRCLTIIFSNLGNAISTVNGDGEVIIIVSFVVADDCCILDIR